LTPRIHRRFHDTLGSLGVDLKRFPLLLYRRDIDKMVSRTSTIHPHPTSHPRTSL
jgi:hypothetical protein